ncbi:hypothetical protein CBS115989_10780 [Aspergillus niger]|nr:hypothetical protein CBS115989_10780 [Aspergillus niger]KAI2834666.1 hypothetical protein CBS11232_10756 [Aspergillus niger]KAI2868921.1 hypothetical protein CBS115988_10377 [Aspergillus niger]
MDGWKQVPEMPGERSRVEELESGFNFTRGYQVGCQPRLLVIAKGYSGNEGNHPDKPSIASSGISFPPLAGRTRDALGTTAPPAPSLSSSDLAYSPRRPSPSARSAFPDPPRYAGTRRVGQLLRWISLA